MKRLYLLVLGLAFLLPSTGCTAHQWGHFLVDVLIPDEHCDYDHDDHHHHRRHRDHCD